MMKGSMVAVVTPMHADGSIDYECYAQLIDWHCEQGTDAIIAVGTTGESATLDFAEHEQVIRFCVKQVNGRVPLIAGTGANATSEAVHLTKQAKLAGADACLLVTPYYNKPTQEGLFRHYQVIAEAVDIPQILYNVPGRTAVDMLPATVARLTKISNIIGIKEASGNMDRMRELIALDPDHFAVYSGDDGIAMESMLAGGAGVISVTANIAPAEMHAMAEACFANNRAQAEQINHRLAALHKDLFVEANPIPVKWALHEMGKIDSGIRLPLTWLSENQNERVRAALKQAGVV
ncbi:MAG: 4-hydroxy-tetrahydrodipicolinate synthase [Gammaproteobacteria bacterium]|nr:4-hydroxy-tetrahydrodipicolinate synthase [Gammaproteobacteria bacterium]